MKEKEVGNGFKTIRMCIDLPAKDDKRIKVLAGAEGMTLKDFVIECIHEKIHPEKKPNTKTRKAVDDARKGKTTKAKDPADLYEQLRI